MGSTPVRSSGKAPVGDLGRQSPPEAEAVCRHCIQILTAEMIKKLKILHNPPTDSSQFFNQSISKFLEWPK